MGACGREGARKAPLFLLGPSGVVSPASQMPLLAIENGVRVVEINPNPTVLTRYVSLSIRGKTAVILP